MAGTAGKRSARPSDTRVNLGLFLSGLAMATLTPHLAAILLSICLDFARAHPRTNQPVAWARASAPGFAAGRLEACHRAFVSARSSAVFFWEMWNYNPGPNGFINTPGAQFLHVFEIAAPRVLRIYSVRA